MNDGSVLRQIRTYLEVHRQATLGDLALHFHTDVEAMRGMLLTWQRKGRVRQLDTDATCNTSCAKGCDDAAMTIYEWVAPAPGTAAGSSFTPFAMVADSSGPAGGACRQHA